MAPTPCAGKTPQARGPANNLHPYGARQDEPNDNANGDSVISTANAAGKRDILLDVVDED